jgi:hypothetical protein
MKMRSEPKNPIHKKSNTKDNLPILNKFRDNNYRRRVWCRMFHCL